MTPGSPSSSSSTSPGHAASGLEVAPDDACDPALERLGHDRLLGVVGDVGGLIAVSPISATPPGSTGSARTRPPAGVPSRSSVDALRVREHAGRRDRVLHDPDRGVRRALFGSFSYITRQMTPAANSEIAIGMKTTVLKATEKRTRSVSTAKTRPIGRDEGGDEQDPERVVLDRRDQRVLGEDLPVVVEPHEVVAGAVEQAPVDRVEDRVDDPDDEEDECRREEAGGATPYERQRLPSPSPGGAPFRGSTRSSAPVEASAIGYEARRPPPRRPPSAA